MFYYFLYPLHDQYLGFNVFKYITFRSFAAFMTGLLIYFIFGRPLIDFLARKQLGQYIRGEGPQHHQAKQGTPTMGGVLIIVAAIFATLLWGNLTNGYTWLCISVFAAFGWIGFLDDYKKQIKKDNEGLKARYKLLFQFLFAGLAGYFMITELGFDTQLYVPFAKHLHPDLGWYYILVVMLVMVGSSNALNLTDGLDGLVAVPTITAFGTYGIFAYIVGNSRIAEYLQVAAVPGAGEVSVFCAAIMGAVIGFLWFNAHPAEIFMGDVGSLSLGGVLGLVALITKNELLLIVVGGIPVIETLSVITQVISFKLTGKRVFRMAPIHHHFELKGWAEPKVIVRFWIISLILAILSLASLKIR